jgi:hypothetical protein
MENKIPYLKLVMTYGAIVGFMLILYQFFLQLAGLSQSKPMGYISFILLILGLYFTLLHFRDKHSNGFITYGRSLGTGTLIGLFTSVILSFFIYLQLKVLDPSILEEVFVMAEDKFLDQGVSEDQVESIMALTRKYTTPGFTAFVSMLTYTFWAFILSLIVSIFVKREGDPFSSAMSEIRNEEN